MACHCLTCIINSELTSTDQDTDVEKLFGESLFNIIERINAIEEKLGIIIGE